MHRVGVRGHVDEDPVLHGPDPRIFGRLAEVRGVQVQPPARRLGHDLVERDVLGDVWPPQPRGLTGQVARDVARPAVRHRRADPDLHDRRQRRGGRRYRRGGRHVVQDERPPLEAAEVDDHVGSLGRREHQPVHPYRAVPHAALGGCRRRRICLSVKWYWPGATWEATTMPAPGTGSGSTNGRRLGALPPSCAVPAAAAPGRTAVTPSAAPAATPY